MRVQHSRRVLRLARWWTQNTGLQVGKTERLTGVPVARDRAACSTSGTRSGRSTAQHQSVNPASMLACSCATLLRNRAGSAPAAQGSRVQDLRNRT